VQGRGNSPGSRERQVPPPGSPGVISADVPVQAAMRLDVPPTVLSGNVPVRASSPPRVGAPHSGTLPRSEIGIGDYPSMGQERHGDNVVDLLNPTVRLGTMYLRYDQVYPDSNSGNIICGCCDKHITVCLACGKICRGPFKTDGSHSCHACDAYEKKSCIECGKDFSIKYPGQFCRSCRRHRLKDRDSRATLPGNDASGQPTF